jgi:hypothetical protein
MVRRRFSTRRGDKYLCKKSTGLCIVWALFWITFQLGALVGFIFIGLASFKLSQEQMNAEAGKSFESVSRRRTFAHRQFLFSAFPPNIAPRCLALSLSYLSAIDVVCRWSSLHIIRLFFFRS